MRFIMYTQCASVQHHNRYGGICPGCARRSCPVTKTMPWLDGQRVRYHKCPDCGRRFPSIDEEQELPAFVQKIEAKEQLKSEALPEEKPKPKPAKKKSAKKSKKAHKKARKK